MNRLVLRLTVSCAFAIAASLLSGSVQIARAQTNPITIDAIISLTGPAAFSGQANSQSLAALEKYTNDHGGVRGQPVHFDIHDDQSSPQVALQLANAAIARHAAVLLGATVTATCAAIGASVADSGPVAYCFSPGYSPPKNSFAFASTLTIDNAGKAILLYAKARGFHRIAYIGATDATGIASAARNVELFKSPDLRGLVQVADEKVIPGEVTAVAQLSKIKAAKPDVLWTSASGPTFATIMHAMADVGLDVPVLTTTANASAPQLKGLSGVLPRYVYFNGFPYQLGDLLQDRQLRDQAKIFTTAFAQIGVAPTAVHALNWDALLLVLAALRQHGPTMTAEQLKSFILAQRHFPGLNGYYDFSSGDQHGLTTNAVVMIGWDRDKQEFYPASQPGGKPM